MTCDKCPIMKVSHKCPLDAKEQCKNLWKRIRQYLRKTGWVYLGGAEELLEEVKK